MPQILKMLCWIVPMSFALAGCESFASTAASRAGVTPAYCPAPGSAVQWVRPDGATAGVVRWIAPAPGDANGTCTVALFNGRHQAVSLVDRVIPPGQEAEMARLMAAIWPFAPGKSAQGFILANERSGALRSMQFQVLLSVSPQVDVEVPAGRFRAWPINFEERNGRCRLFWTAWLDPATNLPVRYHVETANCFSPSQADKLANHLTVPHPGA